MSLMINDVQNILVVIAINLWTIVGFSSCARLGNHPTINAAGSAVESNPAGFNASSTWKGLRWDYSAAMAFHGSGGYWCSGKGDEAPIYWWIYFNEPVKMITVEFQERYPGAVFELFGAPHRFAKAGKTLISGTQSDISETRFENDQYYTCYGLKITTLARSRSNLFGDLATVKDFNFLIAPDIDDCKEKSCSGNGICTDKSCSGNGICTDKINGYSCSCEVGYTGKDCEINIDDCKEQSCSGKGICTDKINGYSCSCNAGYAGKDCEINKDDCKGTSCSGNGKCIDGVDAYNCSCDAGYAGKDCEINIDDCKEQSCSGNGNCIDKINEYSCGCNAGYAGKDCEIGCASDGLLKHPTDCGKFLSCRSDIASGRVRFIMVMDCPIGLHFNEAKQVCDWKASAGCDQLQKDRHQRNRHQRNRRQDAKWNEEARNV